MFRSIEGVYKANRVLFSVRTSTLPVLLPLIPSSEIEGYRAQSLFTKGPRRFAHAMGMSSVLPSFSISHAFPD